MPIHTVKQGEDIDSIAYQYGFKPDTVWDFEDNEVIRELRKNANTLKEGDKIAIPELRKKEMNGETGKKHSFQRVGFQTQLIIRFLDYDESPRAEVPYILKLKTFDDKVKLPDTDGETDADGFVKVFVPPFASEGELTLDPGDDEEVITLKIGHADPLDEGFRGIQSRLNNMGFDCGEENDELNEKTLTALRRFQSLHDLPLIEDDADEVHEDTIEKIRTEYENLTAV